MIGGVDKLEQLQMHKNHSIYDRAMHILETFFSEDTNEVDDIMNLISN